MLTVSNWLLIATEKLFIVRFLFVILFYLRARNYKKFILQEQIRAGETHGQHDGQATKKILAPLDLKELGKVKKKLALSELRIKNLERFRELFFDLKQRVATLMEHQQQVEDELDILMENSGRASPKTKELPSAAHVIHDQQAKIGILIQEIADLEVEAVASWRNSSMTTMSYIKNMSGSSRNISNPRHELVGVHRLSLWSR